MGYKKKYKKGYRNKRKNNTSSLTSLGIILTVFALIGLINSPDNRTVKALLVAGLLMIAAKGIVERLVRNSRKQKLLSASLYKIAEMDGVTFENCCIAHFEKLGYKAKPTATSGDYGADIILEKHKVRTVVQCKRYKGQVGISAVQEVIGAKGYYKADKAMVITNSYYTPNAIRLANANNVELWDRDDIVKIFTISE